MSRRHSAQAPPPLEEPAGSLVVPDIEPDHPGKGAIPDSDSQGPGPQPATSDPVNEKAGRTGPPGPSILRRIRVRPLLTIGLLGGVVLGVLGHFATGRMDMPSAEPRTLPVHRPALSLVPHQPTPTLPDESSVGTTAGEKNALTPVDDATRLADRGPPSRPVPDGHGMPLWRRLDDLAVRLDEALTRRRRHDAALRSHVDALNEQISTTLNRMEDLLMRHSASVQQLADVIASLETRVDTVGQPPVIHTEAAEAEPPGLPPFRMEAIDVWDGVSHVTLSQAGRVAFLQTGDRRAGWTVVRIDPLRRQVEWTDPNGRSHTLSLPR